MGRKLLSGIVAATSIGLAALLYQPDKHTAPILELQPETQIEQNSQKNNYLEPELDTSQRVEVKEPTQPSLEKTVKKELSWEEQVRNDPRFFFQYFSDDELESTAYRLPSKETFIASYLNKFEYTNETIQDYLDYDSDLPEFVQKELKLQYPKGDYPTNLTIREIFGIKDVSKEDLDKKFEEKKDIYATLKGLDWIETKISNLEHSTDFADYSGELPLNKWDYFGKGLEGEVMKLQNGPEIISAFGTGNIQEGINLIYSDKLKMEKQMFSNDPNFQALLDLYYKIE